MSAPSLCPDPDPESGIRSAARTLHCARFYIIGGKRKISIKEKNRFRVKSKKEMEILEFLLALALRLLVFLPLITRPRPISKKFP